MGRNRVQTLAEPEVTATVVLLADYPRPERRRKSPDERRGEILLFTGIRYERLAEPATPDQDKNRRARRRRG
jgi:hypothetical protein